MSISLLLVLFSGIHFEASKDETAKISVYTRLFKYLKTEKTPDLKKFEEELTAEYNIDKKKVLGKLNSLAYKMIHYDRADDAVLVLKLGIVLSPENANLYDSLGEAFMKSGDNSSAIKSYKKSLLLNPKNTNAKKMLVKLSPKKSCGSCSKCFN